MTPTDEQIHTAAQRLSDASHGALGGGMMVFGAEDLSGGAWYSAGSRPDVSGCVVLRVPSRLVDAEEAERIVRMALADSAARRADAEAVAARDERDDLIRAALAAGTTQRAVAEAVGITPAMVARIARGGRGS